MRTGTNWPSVGSSVTMIEIDCPCGCGRKYPKLRWGEMMTEPESAEVEASETEAVEESAEEATSEDEPE